MGRTTEILRAAVTATARQILKHNNNSSRNSQSFRRNVRVEPLEGRVLFTTTYVDNTLLLTQDRDLSGGISVGDQVTFTSPELSVANLTFGEAAQGDDVGSAFDNIQTAIDSSVVQNGDTVRVAAGTYVGSVSISKSIALQGANAGVNPNTGTRNDETVLMTDGDWFVVGVETNNVTIDGVTLEGDNPDLTGGVPIGTADADSYYGTLNYDNNSNDGYAVNNLTVQNSVVKDFISYGLYLDAYGQSGPSSGNLITSNRFDNFLNDDGGVGVGLLENAYGQVTDNTINAARVGVQTGNNYLANTTGAPVPLIDSNTITGSLAAIFHNLQYSSATPWTISDNTITASSKQRTTGIILSSLSNGAPTISGNNVSGAGVGIDVWNNATTLTISGGTLVGNDYGVYAATRTGVGFGLVIDDARGGQPPRVYQTATGSFSPLVGDGGLAGDIATYAANPSGSTTGGGIAAHTFDGKIALLDSAGSGHYAEQVKNAQDAGAIAVIVADTTNGAFPDSMGDDDPTHAIRISSWIVSKADGDSIKSELASGNVHATLASQPWTSSFGNPHPFENAGDAAATLDGVSITNSAKAGVYVRDVPNADTANATNSIALHVTGGTSVTGSPVGAPSSGPNAHISYSRNGASKQRLYDATTHPASPSDLRRRTLMIRSATPLGGSDRVVRVFGGRACAR